MGCGLFNVTCVTFANLPLPVIFDSYLRCPSSFYTKAALNANPPGSPPRPRAAEVLVGQPLWRAKGSILPKSAASPPPRWFFEAIRGPFAGEVGDILGEALDTLVQFGPLAMREFPGPDPLKVLYCCQ
jgi:hypothetical protein